MNDEALGQPDEALSGAWATLDPAAEQRRRIEAQLTTWLDAHDTSLPAEWLALFRVAPLPAFGLAAVSAVSIAAAPPLIWLAQALI